MAPDKAVTERIEELEARIKLLERELLSYSDRESESRLRRAEIASGSGNWEIHLDSGKILGSEGALRLYGVHNPEMDYAEIRDIPLPECRPILDNALKELISENKPYNVEFKAKNAETGKIIDLHATAEFDSKNRKVFGVIKDITKQKASEEQIRKKSQDLATLLEITMELLEAADRRTVLKNILEGAKKLIGLETGAVYSVQNDTLILESTIPPLPDNFPDEFRRALLINHPNIANALEKGRPVIVPDIKGVTLTPQESVITTERDMRTLLFIPLIASGEIIHQSNNQLLRIINDIFNVSHIEAGQILLNENVTKMRPELPVIAQTAYTDVIDRQKALDSGYDDFLPKPITKASLFEVVEKYLS